jgi:hypothetical protein
MGYICSPEEETTFESPCYEVKRTLKLIQNFQNRDYTVRAARLAMLGEWRTLHRSQQDHNVRFPVNSHVFFKNEPPWNRLCMQIASSLTIRETGKGGTKNGGSSGDAEVPINPDEKKAWDELLVAFEGALCQNPRNKSYTVTDLDDKFHWV